MKEAFLEALQGVNQGRPPVWVMRQAGRYLPAYQELRRRFSFHEMTHQAELVVKVTLMPFSYFPLDAAIVFSDILTLLEVWGITVEMVEGFGPKVDTPLKKVQNIYELPKVADWSVLEPVYQAIGEIKRELSKPLIGFCGAPFTLASYLIEGGAFKDLSKTRSWIAQDRVAFIFLMDQLCELGIAHLKAQVGAGVDAVQIFDSWACHLTQEEYAIFCAPYHKKMVEALERPVILFTKETSRFLPFLTEAKPACVSCDWSLSLKEAFERIPKNIAVQGNLDPHILFRRRSEVKEAVEQLLGQVTEPQRYIFNLGHGILPQTPLENVQQMLESVHAWMN